MSLDANGLVFGYDVVKRDGCLVEVDGLADEDDEAAPGTVGSVFAYGCVSGDGGRFLSVVELGFLNECYVDVVFMHDVSELCKFCVDAVNVQLENVDV